MQFVYKLSEPQHAGQLDTVVLRKGSLWLPWQGLGVAAWWVRLDLNKGCFLGTGSGKLALQHALKS